MVSEPILDPDVGVYSIWPRNSMGHNEDVASTWECLSHLKSDMGETSSQFISMCFSQPSRLVLKQ